MKRNSAQTGSIGEYVRYRWPNRGARRYLPWPPDAFGITASILRDTGTYIRVLDNTALGNRDQGEREKWRDTCVENGVAWREKINARLLKAGRSHWFEPLRHTVIPRPVKQDWQVILDHFDTPMESGAFPDELVKSLLSVCIAADCASSGLGLFKMTGREDEFMLFASAVNDSLNVRQNFCVDLDSRKICVMPKLHTPQRGLTSRSLSHHLALIESSELRAHWWAPLPVRKSERFDILNLLLLPWPRKIRTEQFHLVGNDTGCGDHFAKTSRLFAYTPEQCDPNTFRTQLKEAIDKASRHVQRVHAVILPELSLNEEQYEIAEEVALEERVILIAGVLMRDEAGWINAAVTQPMGFARFDFDEDVSFDDEDGGVAEMLRIVQPKHHRWCLDRSQIIQYGLGGKLPASKNCWEDMIIKDRRLNFLTFADWMTMGILVCEDLARQDPVSEALRAVAPSLVVALLMDGPQLRNRWSSRYATVLAEDPGCSVLTLTSLGMTERSKPRGLRPEDDKSRVIALWRDAIHGAEEIEIDDDADGCVLSLVYKTEEEVTADGRGDRGSAIHPVFAGVHQVR